MIIWNIYKAIICQQMLNKINNNFCFIIIKKKITKNNQLVCYEIRLLYTYKWKIFCTIFMVISSFINLLSPYVITNQWLRLPIIIYLSIKNILKHDPIFQVESQNIVLFSSVLILHCVKFPLAPNNKVKLFWPHQLG